MSGTETTFKILSWDEDSIEEFAAGGKVTKAVVKQQYTGEIQAESVVNYTMLYKPDGSAEFLGYECITGSYLNKQGSFIIRHDGVFENGAAKSQWHIVAGTVKADLDGLFGNGSFFAGHDGVGHVQLDLNFENE